MLKLQILFRRLVLAALAVAGATALVACGQKGALYLPTGPDAAQRATLPQVISATLPLTSSSTLSPAAGVAAPAAPASSPSR